MSINRYGSNFQFPFQHYIFNKLHLENNEKKILKRFNIISMKLTVNWRRMINRDEVILISTTSFDS